MDKPYILQIDSLTGDWVDVDIVMLHSCFKLLTDCVEGENLLNCHIDWDYDEEHIIAKNEIKELYDWWIERKNNDKLDRIEDLEKAQYAIDNEMLIRLIKIRHHLWT